MKINEKGFSIIEILLTTVLVGMVAAAVSYFIITGVKTSNSAESQINLQTEAQVIINQLTSFTMEGNDAEFVDIGNGNYVYVLYHTDKVTESATKEEIVLYKSSVKKMYLYELESIPAPDEINSIKEELTNPSVSISVGELMCDYVDDFSVSCEKKPVIQFTVKLIVDGKSYSSTTSVEFRSKMTETKTEFFAIP